MPVEVNRTEQVDLFLAKVDGLVDSALVKSGFSPGFSLTAKEGQPAELLVRQPDETQLKAFLMDFRHFILNDEPVNVGKVFNLCFRLCAEGELKTLMRETNKRWKAARGVGSIEFVVDEMQDQLRPDFLLDLYINGLYFHTDDEKAKKLEQLRATGLAFDRHIFFEHLWATLQYLIILRNQIRAARRDGLLEI